MTLTAVLPLIVVLSHDYLHILLRNFFLCNHCNTFLSDFHIRTVQHIDIIKGIYSPTNAQINCLDNNIKFTLK